MRRLTITLAVALAAAASIAGVAGSARARPAALSCGLPAQQPVWIDYADGAVSFWRERFARPGVVIATGAPALAAEARAAGAATVDWDMYLRKRVGTPSDPADPSTIDARADKLFDYAVTVSGCQTPLIALNELWGASMPTPLTPTAERYRANVLEFVTQLSRRGARPALLVSAKPYTDGDAATWWKAIASVSDIVLENYANANYVWREGPIEGSRRLRVRHRQAAEQLLSLGIPASRVGIMIGFQTNPGSGGREGLTPRSRWFQVAKWHALAVGRVARELELAHVWSWGWAQRDAASGDPDKTYAACVWLWTRDPGLCDAPGILGAELDPDVTTGQLNLPRGTRCTYDGAAISTAGVKNLARVTQDPDLALTALVVRAIESERDAVSLSRVPAVERRIVTSRFGGSRSAYLSALAGARMSAGSARSIIADELRQWDVSQRLSSAAVSATDVGRFRATYAAVDARRVKVSPAPSWLPGGSGVALATSAPAEVFRIPSGKTSTVQTIEGPLAVEPLDDSTQLDALPVDVARPAVVRELRAQGRVAAYAAWSLKVQRAAETKLVCERDALPEIGVVSLTSYAPFLSLDEAEADRWLAARRSSRSG